jgi:threonine synthase
VEFISTRAGVPPAGFGAALRQGMASDGGLYVPSRWPSLPPEVFADAASLPEFATRLIAPFAESDPLAAHLPAMTAEAFDFPVPLTPVAPAGGFEVLELIHGPTAAFKDVGARFLAAALARLRKPGEPVIQILVATSGDTGGAVAAAFHGREGIAVTVLYPQGLVSPTQEQQLTCWGGNVRAFAVQGRFDDCQRLVKEAFADPALTARYELSSANSINLGRLLPQASYYARASLSVWRRHRRPASFIIPTGNLGNALACVWAREMGLPIEKIVLAVNANRTIPNFLDSGEWRPTASIATLASAMDVGNPSNMERLRHRFPALADLRAAVSAVSVDDAGIRARIVADFGRYERIWCPHTAVAAEVYERMSPAERAAHQWVVVATAHPAKFSEILVPLVGDALQTPPSLQALYDRPSRHEVIAAELAALRSALLALPA